MGRDYFNVYERSKLPVSCKLNSARAKLPDVKIFIPNIICLTNVVSTIVMIDFVTGMIKICQPASLISQTLSKRTFFFQCSLSLCSYSS